MFLHNKFLSLLVSKGKFSGKTQEWTKSLDHSVQLEMIRISLEN
jgi:hypothetical protein